MSGAQIGETRAIVAIPVRNEQGRIEACLDALNQQLHVEPVAFEILLFLNNCTDETRFVVDGCRDRLVYALHVIECDSAEASAGWARRRAMQAAAKLLERDGRSQGILLTSDADSRVPPNWVAANLAAIRGGADLVAGRIALDPVERDALPAHVHARGRLESEYEGLLTEIGARLAPEPGNPWPCHWTKSGATLAVRASVYEAVGGMPDIPAGEDRAFVDKVNRAGYVVRHAPEIEVVTSGRLHGRATGGVADTMRQRCEHPDAFCDDRLEPVARYLRRVLLDRRMRPPRAGNLSPRPLPTKDAGRTMAYRPLRPTELPRQIRTARFVLRLLKASSMFRSIVRSMGGGTRASGRISPTAAPLQISEIVSRTNE